MNDTIDALQKADVQKGAVPWLHQQMNMNYGYEQILFYQLRLPNESLGLCRMVSLLDGLIFNVVYMQYWTPSFIIYSWIYLYSMNKYVQLIVYCH